MKWWEWLIVALVILWLVDRNKAAAPAGDPIAAALAPHLNSELQSTALLRAGNFFDEGGENTFTLTQPVAAPAGGSSFVAGGGGGAGGSGSGGAGGNKGQMQVF